MSDPNNLREVQIAKALEQLRQERELFDQRTAQERGSFRLRLAMGYGAIALLAAIVVIASYILLDRQYSDTTKAAAGAALFVDILGLLTGIWKLTLSPKTWKDASTTSKIKIPDLSDDDIAVP